MSDCIPLNDGAHDATRAPATQLYRHALESVFKFCALKELHAILAVCRDWSSAVHSMPPTRRSVTVASIERLSLIARSRLSRHVTVIRGGCAYTPAGLQILANRMPWIESAWFEISPQGNLDCAEEALALSRLTQTKALFVNVHGRGAAPTAEVMTQHAVAANHLIRAAACMRQLEQFTLSFMCHDDRILLGPLVALTRLRMFSVLAPALHSALPSDEQVAALRQMHSIEAFHHKFTDRNGTLRLLLSPTPTPPLRWTLAAVTSGAADLLPLLQSLPDLSSLDVDCRCGDVEFLLSLPRVLKLTLQSSDGVLGPADLTRIVTTVQRCPQLTSLTVIGLAFTSAQLGLLLPALPQLSEISMITIEELTSLSFFATDALAASLTSLRIIFCARVPSGEIVHLLGLRSLQRMYLFGLRESLSESQTTQLRSAHPRARLDL